MNLIAEAKKIQNGKACPQDIDLLVKVMDKLGGNPTVVMLGAGEVFTLTIFGAKHNTLLYTIDNDPHAHEWEQAAKENCKVTRVNHVQLLGNSVNIAKNYKGPKIDLLIVDACHTVEGCLADLYAWERHMKKAEHYIFCHDYDAEEAPRYYPGVKQACDRYFKKRFSWREGWSAVWKVVKK